MTAPRPSDPGSARPDPLAGITDALAHAMLDGRLAAGGTEAMTERDRRFLDWGDPGSVHITPNRDDAVNCASCAVAGIAAPATTSSSNPEWSGYALCADCAAEYDARSPQEAPP